MFHVARDYRNWILPFIPSLVGTLFLHLVRYFFDISALEYINSSVKPALKLIISIIIKMELCLFIRLWPCFCYFYVCHAIQSTNGYSRRLKKLSPPFYWGIDFLSFFK
jgi:hypothetical protein